MIDLNNIYQGCAWISSVLFAICFLPQLYTTLRYRVVEGINPWMWVILLMAYGTGLIFSIGTWQPPLVMNFGFGVFIALTMLVCHKLFKRDVKPKRVKGDVYRVPHDLEDK